MLNMMINTLGPRQNGWHFPDDIFKCIFLNENVWILIKISLKFVPKVQISYIPALVRIMAWVSLLTHICVTLPQWVKLGKKILMWVSFNLTGLIRNIGIIMLIMNNEIKLFIMSELPQQQKCVDDDTVWWHWRHGLSRDADFIMLLMNYEVKLPHKQKCMLCAMAITTTRTIILLPCL